MTADETRCECGHVLDGHQPHCTTQTQMLPKTSNRWEACECRAFKAAERAPTPPDAGGTHGPNCDAVLSASDIVAGITSKPCNCRRAPDAGGTAMPDAMPTADDTIVSLARREVQTGRNANRPDRLLIMLRDLLAVCDKRAPVLRTEATRPTGEEDAPTETEYSLALARLFGGDDRPLSLSHPDYMLVTGTLAALRARLDRAEGEVAAAVTRFEVIDHRAASLTPGRWLAVHDCAVELSYQDDGRTLKVFLGDSAALSTPTPPTP